MNINYTIVKNEMDSSAAEAPYLGKIIPNGVRNRAQMVENILDNELFAENTFNAILDTCVTLTKELCAEGRDVDWGPIKFMAKIGGSFPCEDSSFTDGTATLAIAADATNDIREACATLTPVKLTASELRALVQVSNIMDVTTEEFGVIVGGNQFAVLGNGITLDGEGEYVKALDRKTGEVKGTATIVSVVRGQRAFAKFSPSLAAGHYTLEIATKGVSDESTPRIFHKSVECIAADTPPSLTGVVQGSRTDGKIGFGEGASYATVLSGTIPGGFKSGDALKIQGAPTEAGVYQAAIDLTEKVTASTETTITLGNGFGNTSAFPDGDWDNKSAKLTLGRNGVEYTLDVEFLCA